MKKRKGSLLQRMMAVLLSAVLVVSMAANAAPVTVLAQEAGEEPESVSGNKAETVEGDTELGTVSGNDAGLTEEADPEGQEPDTGAEQETQEPDAGVEQETPEPDAGTTQEMPGGAGTEEEAEPETVSGNDEPDEKNGNLQALLEEIDALPDAEEYLAMEPDADGGEAGVDAYEQWLAGLYAHAEEVLAIQEAAEELSEEERAQIPEEALAKLAAWTAVARTAGESAQVMTMETTSGTCGDNVEWTLADGVLTISGSGAIKSYSGDIIPSPWNSNKTDIVSLVIEDGVTGIGSSAFDGCSSLTSVTIAGSVERIGDSAFYRCSSLTDVIMQGNTPPTLDMISVFFQCKFFVDKTTGIHVPEGTTEAYKTKWTYYADYIVDGTPTPPAEEHKHNDVTFSAWTAADSLPDTAGNYYLTENVTLTETWTVPNGTTTLCLNGKTISASGTDGYRVITINISPVLNLYDCRNTGNITGGKGGGVWNGGTFCMYGGKISGNATQTYNHGGGVWNNNNFYMYGGEISGNTASMGFGGGVETYGEFRMYGGKISGNTAGGSGGGVHINGSGEFIVGGDAVISGNTYNGKENNVYLKDGQWIEVDSNLLSGSANIGVTTATAPTEGNPVSVTGHNKGDCSQYFHSDNAAYEIVNAYDVVRLTVKASPDTQPPTGKIEVATGDLTSASWTEFLAPDKVAFHLFFKDRKWVTIFSADEGGSGVYGTHYYVSNNALTKAQVEALEADAWTADGTVILEPEPDRRCIVYAKITDGAGNVTYLSSDGLVFDATPPVISGVTDGETYNAPQTVAVTDAMSGVKSVTVNGTEVTLTDNQFTLGTADGSQTIVAADQAGNTTTVTVTVKVQTQTYAVTVHKGTGTGIYEAGATVTITADAPASGKQFDRWTVNSGSVTLADAMSSTTTFTMPAGAVSVTAAYKDITEEHTHDYGNWQHDSTQHWKVCSCGAETDRGNHDFGDWVTDQEATATETGTKHRVCQTCNRREEGIIPATGTDPGTGTVTPEVRPGANAPATNISTPAEELKDMLLTDGEKQQVQNGTNIRIVLEVQDAGNNVSASDQAAVQQALNGFTVGQYLNIDLYKLVGTDRTDINETAKKIRIVIAVPDSLKNAGDSKTRTFAVIRVHDGRAELLADLDDAADTITIETDRFSTYAVVHNDAANGGSGNDNGNNGNDSSSQNNSGKNDAKSGSSKESEPKTGDDTHLELYATLAMIQGFAYLLLYFTDKDRGMTEETKKELVSRLVGWAKRGGKIRKWLALAAIFVLLVYYHGTKKLYRSIGKKACAEQKEIYGE